MAGKGNYPFNSAWAYQKQKQKRLDFLRTQTVQPTTDNGVIWRDWFFDDAEVTYYGILKRWTGAAWTKETIQVYLGSWQSRPLKRWTGTEWVLIDTTGV